MKIKIEFDSGEVREWTVKSHDLANYWICEFADPASGDEVMKVKPMTHLKIPSDDSKVEKERAEYRLIEEQCIQCFKDCLTSLEKGRQAHERSQQVTFYRSDFFGPNGMCRAWYNNDRKRWVRIEYIDDRDKRKYVFSLFGVDQ